ncbi:phosphoprotein phosphatase-like protein [Zalerion maritima]|uniref:Phosphoprotein phosphatase-like protein n=1 Tax=Zalerion maritima TaxID=339359 RepID=A0AAD5RQX7_9PEZI|nr:phosphoprotein phosphatase-like protein [Zalerion maritima]
MRRLCALFNPSLKLSHHYHRRAAAAMSTGAVPPTIADVKYLLAGTLRGMMLGEHPSVAVVDVRDSDHLGGHIKGSLHFPSGTLESMMPTLIRKVEDKKAVVFHCALSQQRGPSAAVRYLREMYRLGKWPKEGEAEAEAEEGQTVYVLDKGFVGWQEEYGEDERLTEGYRKEIWKDGYWM